MKRQPPIVKLSTANADRLQQRWTRQLLRGSALLPRSSTLKLASGAFLRLAFYARPALPHRRNSYTGRFKVSVVEWQRKNKASIQRTAKHFSIEGGRNRERKCHIPRISPPPFALCKGYGWKRGGGGVFAGTLRYSCHLAIEEMSICTESRVYNSKSVQLTYGFYTRHLDRMTYQSAVKCLAGT